jgi:hypothetical protein
MLGCRIMKMNNENVLKNWIFTNHFDEFGISYNNALKKKVENTNICEVSHYQEPLSDECYTVINTLRKQLNGKDDFYLIVDPVNKAAHEFYKLNNSKRNPKEPNNTNLILNKEERFNHVKKYSEKLKKFSNNNGINLICLSIARDDLTKNYFRKTFNDNYLPVKYTPEDNLVNKVNVLQKLRYLN